MELFFRETGEGAQPLLIQHGLFGSSDNWLTLARIIGEKFKVYLPDARNHGRSPHDPAMDYPAMGRDLAAFVERHALRNPIMVGHSMGGKAVMEYARICPGGFDKLVVVDIAPKQYPMHHQDIVRALQEADLEGAEGRTEVEAALARYIPEPDVRQFLLKSLYRTEDKAFAWRFNLAAIAPQLAALVAPNPFPETPIDKPALFIRGSRSNYVSDSDLPLIRSAFPQARLHTVEGAGHWVHAEQPGAFLEALMAFCLA